MWKSTIELGCFVNLHAIDLPQLFGQPRVDGVEPRRHQAKAATEPTSRRSWGARNLISTQSSTKGSFVKCNIKGSSVDKDTSRPRLKYLGNGDLEKSRNNLLFDKGDIAMPMRAK